MIAKLWHTINRIVDAIASYLPDPLLLAIRLYWGWQFFVGGKAKLADIDGFAVKFGEWGIPMPKANVILASSTETVGGLLLLVGLFSRLTAIPLIFTMCVAYLTADRQAVNEIFSNPDGFVTANPFLFLFASVIIFVFGPGRVSADELIRRRFQQS